MNYGEALAYLDSLETLGIRPGLDRIRRLLRRLGNPERRFPSVLIAGTNGKGSCTAFLAAILKAAGIAPGVYTSPHLLRFEERIVIGPEEISRDEVARLTGEVRAGIEAERFDAADHPTYFEATTALAFLHFQRRAVPLAVLEVGMGGTHDATNAVTPVVCAITRIAIDHTRWLGSTLPEIAGEKAGILKAGVPAVVARQEEEAMRAIGAAAQRIGAPLLPTGACRIEVARPAADPPAFSLATPAAGAYPPLALALRGAHQIDNAVAAVLLAEQLRRSGFPGIDSAAVVSGLARAAWPGRIEILPGRPDVLLDGAHNPSGCAVLADYLRAHQSGRRIVLVFAAMKDKPAGAMLDLLLPPAHAVFVTGLAVARGSSPDALAGEIQRRAAPAAGGGEGGEIRTTSSVAEALPLARRAAGPDGLVVVSGSLYLVGEAKRVLS